MKNKPSLTLPFTFELMAARSTVSYCLNAGRVKLSRLRKLIFQPPQCVARESDTRIACTRTCTGLCDLCLDCIIPEVAGAVTLFSTFIHDSKVKIIVTSCFITETDSAARQLAFPRRAQVRKLKRYS